MPSHHIPFFTVRRRQLQQAACGEFVDVSRHTNEPDCPTSLAWLVEDERDFIETSKALAEEFPDLASRLLP